MFAMPIDIDRESSRNVIPKPNLEKPALRILLFASQQRAIGVHAWRFDSPIIKEVCKVTLVLMFCLATMAAFVALGVWIWIPYSHH